MPKTVLITGCSSGIGKAAAVYFAGKGCNVVATMRTPSCAAGEQLAAMPNVLVTPLDVTDRDAADSAVAACIAKFGSLDVVINNAGYALYGPAEFSTKTQVLAQLETNVYGPLAVTQSALAHFRAGRSGLVINVGSLAAKVPFPFMPVYVASKFALDGLTEALNLELVPLGIRVKIVHPGVVETPAMSNIDVAEVKGVDEYTQLMKGSNEAFPGMFEGLASSAEHVASVLYEAATDGTEKVRYPVGEDCLQFLAARHEKSDEEWEKHMLENFRLQLGK